VFVWISSDNLDAIIDLFRIVTDIPSPSISFNICNRQVGQVYNLATLQGRMPTFAEFLQHPRQFENLPHPEI
jgi:hypothetical protein